MCCRDQGVELGSCIAIAAGLLPDTLQPTAAGPPRAAAAAAAADAPRQRTPVLITRGDRDDVMPSSNAEASVRMLSAAGSILLLMDSVEAGT